MSKMSQLAADLEVQAAQLGFESADEAVANGYTVDYIEGRLVKHECCDIAKEQEQAHLAYIAEREEHLNNLYEISNALCKFGYDSIAHKIEEAMLFFRRGE